MHGFIYNFLPLPKLEKNPFCFVVVVVVVNVFLEDDAQNGHHRALIL